jgi:hypothetical protein
MRCHHVGFFLLPSLEPELEELELELLERAMVEEVESAVTAWLSHGLHFVVRHQVR